MTDITKCLDDKCPVRSKCYRWTAPTGEYQSYAAFKHTSEKGCDHFYERKSYDLSPNTTTWERKRVMVRLKDSLDYFIEDLLQVLEDENPLDSEQPEIHLRRLLIPLFFNHDVAIEGDSIESQTNDQ